MNLAKVKSRATECFKLKGQELKSCLIVIRQRLRKGFFAKAFSLLLIAGLTWLLLGGLAAVWGRLFYAAYPSNFLSKFYQWVRTQWPYNIVLSLHERYLPLWNLVSDMAYSDDGKLAPIQWIFNLVGLGSLTLTSLNEYAAKRCQGILLGDVLRFFFPFHRLILRGFHIVFFLLGNYACIKLVSTAAAVCLAGMLLCLIYSFLVSRLLSVPTSGKKIIIHIYLSAALRRNMRQQKFSMRELQPELKHSEDLQEWEVQSCLLDYACYVGSLWRRPGYQPSYSYCTSEEFWLVKATMAWVKNCTKRCIEREIVLNGTTVNMNIATKCASAFTSLCSTTPPDNRIISEICLPYGESTARANFQSKVLRCRLLWETLLLQTDELHRKSQLAHYILSCAYSSSAEHFALLACGLLLHMGIFDLTLSEKRCAEQIADGLLFLESLVQIEKERKAVLRESGSSKFCTGLGELIYITISGVFWEVAEGYISEADANLLRKKVGSTLGILSLGECQALEQSSIIYATFALLLQYTANTNLGQPLSIRKMQRWYEYVKKELAYVVI